MIVTPELKFQLILLEKAVS
jgi:26S proteasome regulatory subunit N3